MSIITGTIKGLLSFKPKERFDGYTDQYHRVFMVKMSMVASVLLGMNWLSDTMSCIIPDHHGISGGFTSQACWIQGFFVYKELQHVPGMFGYYGIPKDFEDNGYYPRKNDFDDVMPCTVSPNNPGCVPYTRTFYKQYQWFPFYVAALGLLFYIPYVLFRAVNTDVISLKRNLKTPGDNIVTFTTNLIDNYFNQAINTARRMKMTVISNVLVKCLYIVANMVAFCVTDAFLHGEFTKYGMKWMSWSKQPNELEYDYTKARRQQDGNNPANVLLPTFGLCEVLELAKDIKHTLYNKHQFVCEISQNVLYQYVLLILWFLFILGLVVSVIGLLMEVGDHLLTWYAFIVLQGDQTRKVYAKLTLRECHYLEHIRKKNMTIYGEVIRQLKKSRVNFNSPDEVENDYGVPEGPYKESKKLLGEMREC